MLSLNSRRRSPVCFISYPPGKRRVDRLMRSVVIPTIKALGIESTYMSQISSVGDDIYNRLVRSIRECDFLVSDLTYYSPHTVYELGLAHAWGKPTVIICNTLNHRPLDIASKYPIVMYGPPDGGDELFAEKLKAELSNILTRPYSLSSPTIMRYIERASSISIEFLDRDPNPIEVFEFISDFLTFFRLETDPTTLRVGEIRPGSLGAWISTQVEPITKLVEKIIFFIPEWQARSANREKTFAETDKIRAEADKIRAEAEATRSDTKIREVEAFMRVLEKAQSLGSVRVTLGDRMRIESSPDHTMEIGLPFDTNHDSAAD